MSELKTILLAYIDHIGKLGVSVEDVELEFVPDFKKRELRSALAGLLREGRLSLSKNGRIHIGSPS